MTRITVFLLYFSFFYCSKNDWIRKLPENHTGSPILVSGEWYRKTNPKSAMNSSWHKNSWSEEIFFDRPEKGFFIKIYKNVNNYGSDKVSIEITGRGKYSISGNWLLLKTTEKQTIKEEKEKSCCEGFIPFHHKLLYFYYEEEKALVPMIFESGYKEENFGVKDGVDIPYRVDKNFKIYLDIYTGKEYHSHAFFYRGEN